MPFLRLRQICLVAHDLGRVVDDLCAVLGLTVCHRDPGVARFGLHNALMRLGDNFIEVVAPLPGGAGEGTAAGRHLQRHGGDTGYMAIFDCDDVTSWIAHVAACGVRVASLHQVDGYTGLQLHPRDTGGALIEINHTAGGEAPAALWPYWPAGANCRDAPDSTLASALAGVGLLDADPARLAARWAEVLRRPLQDKPRSPDAQGNGRQIDFDDASWARFLPIHGETAGQTGRIGQVGQIGQGPGFSVVDLKVRDQAAILHNARLRACKVDQAGEENGVPEQVRVQVGGVWWTLGLA